MRRMTLVGLCGERAATVDALANLGCVHLDQTQVIEKTLKNADEQGRGDLQRKISEVNDCLSFFKFCKKEGEKLKLFDKQHKPEKAPAIKAEMALEEFSDLMQKEEKRLYDEVIFPLSSLSRLNYEAETNIQWLQNLIAELTPFKNANIPFNEIKDTQHTSVFFGLCQKEKGKILQAFEETEGVAEVYPTESKSVSLVFAVCLNNDREVFAEKLNQLGFVKCQFDFPASAHKKIAECEEKIKELESQKKEYIVKACGYAQSMNDVKMLYDFYEVNLQKLNAEGNLNKTQKTFLLYAWIPFDREEDVVNKLDQVMSAKMIDFRDPFDDEEPPTLTRNNKIVSPYESITNMYSVPNYRERDPNSFVAVFYFLFFGIMLGDAGYGIILTVATLLFAKIVKPQEGMRKLLFVLAMGGVSTVLWGFMFGGWFAIDTAGTVLQPILFNPLENPIGMIALSIGLGALHLCVGMVLNAVAKAERGKWLDGLLDDVVWVLFFLFIAALAVGMALSLQRVQDVGLYGMLGCLVVVLLTAGRHKKGMFGKIFGGFGGLYNIIGFLSDLLSYLRLFGLGLATGVIGMVFNEIANIFTGPIGMIFAVVILLVGHTLNIAINVLGVYVHDSRLQYIEFFSKFYTGEGYLFTPIVGETKYTKIIN